MGGLRVSHIEVFKILGKVKKIKLYLFRNLPELEIFFSKFNRLIWESNRKDFERCPLVKPEK